MTEKKNTSFRLTPAARQMLEKLAAALGVSQTAVLELIIREKAKQEDIT